jgi:uncharacterized protein (TIGR02646 family)
MRTIRKGDEPRSLTEHRLMPHANYENYADKDGLRKNLVKEQRGLCCYCLSRIRPTPVGMKIEHWHCQDTYPNEQLEYSNLLGACLGNEGQAQRDQHCDTRKANMDVSRNPAIQMHNVETLVRFRGDGRIVSDDPAFNDELNRVLNLNIPLLKNNRKETLSAFIAVLSKRGPLSRVTLQKWLRHWNGDSHGGELTPFCQVVIYWLCKRLSRA